MVWIEPLNSGIWLDCSHGDFIQCSVSARGAPFPHAAELQSGPGAFHLPIAEAGWGT